MASTTPTPTTTLDAVNYMLLSIGESPINSLDNAANMVDVSLALLLLNEVSKDLQAKGWQFNSEIKYPLIPDLDTGNVTVPSNWFSLVIHESQLSKYDIVQRGSRVYDRKNQTYVFTETLYFNALVYLSFDDLPEPARRYVMIRAARQFQDKLQTTDNLHTYTAQDENNALHTLESYEYRTGRPNVFNNYDVYRIIDRTPIWPA